MTVSFVKPLSDITSNIHRLNYDGTFHTQNTTQLYTGKAWMNLKIIMWNKVRKILNFKKFKVNF